MILSIFFDEVVPGRVDRSSLLLLALTAGTICACSLPLCLRWRWHRTELLGDGSGLLVSIEGSVGDGQLLRVVVCREARCRIEVRMLVLLRLLVLVFLVAFMFTAFAIDGRCWDLARIGVEDSHVAKPVLATG